MSTKKAHKEAGARRAAGLGSGEHAALYAALTAERDGYVRRGLKERAQQVDNQLKALGKPKPAAKAAAAPTPEATASTTRRGTAKQQLAEANPPAAPEVAGGVPAKEAAQD